MPQRHDQKGLSMAWSLIRNKKQIILFEKTAKQL
jgi:hypothetical protein